MADDIVGQYYLANALRQGQRQSTRSMLAQRMMQNALDTSPTTPLGALARALTGAVSAVTMQRAEEGDRLDQKMALGSLMDRDQQQQDEATAWQARMNGQGAQPPAGGAAPAPAPVTREALPDIGAPAPQGAPQPAQPGGDLVPRIIQAEAGNQGPQGMAAVASVIQNRARLTGMTPEQVVQQAGQFEPWGRRRQDVLGMPPERFASAADIWRQVSGGQMPDPTGGATHFLNPDLQRQLGRQMPAWAPEGQGQRIGAHVFYARPEDFRRAQVAGPGAPTEPAAPGGTVEASPPGSVQATLDALRQQAAPAAPAAAPAAPAVNMQALAEGLASNNPRIQRAAQAQLQALQLQRQTESERRAEAAAGRAADAAARQAGAAERQAAAAGRGPLPRGMQLNPQTGQLEDIPGMPREPFSGDSIDAQASNVMLRIGPRIANGTASDQERQQYALAHSHLTAPSLQQVPVDPNDPSKGMALAMVPRRAPDGFPAPDFRPQAPAASGVPGAALPQQQGSPGAGNPPATQGAGPGSQGSPAPGGAQIIPGTARGPAPQALEAARQAEVGTGRALDAINNFRAALEPFRGQTGLSVLNPRDAQGQRLASAFEILKMAMRDESLLNTGVLQPGEARMLQSMLRDPSSISGLAASVDGYHTMLDQFSGFATRGANRVRAAAGLPGIDWSQPRQGVTPDPRAGAQIPGTGLSAAPPAAGAAGAVTHRFNPQTGRVEAVN